MHTWQDEKIKIHQIVPSLRDGDAIGNEVIEIRNALRRMGYDSEIFAEYIHPNVSKIARQLHEYKKNADNTVIYHFGVAGFEITEFVKHLPDKKILIYHNVTPPHFFKNINDSIFKSCLYGRNELNTLNKFVMLALGDSEYNKYELDNHGYNNTGILPILIDFSKYNISPNKETIQKFNDDYVNLIFVGRISPNKKQEDLIKVFYYYQKINPKSRLIIVGSNIDMEKYFDKLQKLIKKLNLTDVFFTGQTSFDEMIAYYNLADVFLCMSEHEGFCVPLLEAMYFNVPIIGYNSSAVPYTLGGCGIIVNEKRYEEIAELINLLINDELIRKKIIENQKIRLLDFDMSKTEQKLKKYIQSVILTKESEIIKLVSIVICTYNRASYLERCLESLKKQTYLQFEIIVVNGPSTDETDRVLAKYPEIKIIRQEKLNGLSFARNLGIKECEGKIVAFIDDDALADENWIKYLVEGYVDESVGGVGGLVKSPEESNMPPIQFDRGIINKWAIPTAIRKENDELKENEFPIIMGTNSSFRKDILNEVNCFDPYFGYYHDESDLCVRIIKKGYKIVYKRNAFVIHYMVEGHNRKSTYEMNYSEIMKNNIYFIVKNFRGEFLSYTLRPAFSLYSWFRHLFIYPYLKKNISLIQLFVIYSKLFRGAIKGYIDGLKFNVHLMITSKNI
jgi:GT2 family glycosyltransferase/glycosyltransferase involved in cell wall biosynthesis